MKSNPIIIFRLIILSVLLLQNCVVPLSYGQAIKYGTGNWDAAKLGNHRAIVHIEKAADAVLARIEWRRRDHHPENIEVIVTDADGKKMDNVVRKSISREYGEIIFQPVSGKGDYYFYYLPNIRSGSNNYPTVNYLKPASVAAKSWSSKITPGSYANLPVATASEFQSIDAFNSFYPMEFIATQDEVKQLINRQKKPFLVFPEMHRYSIRMTRDIPKRWIDHGSGGTLVDTASLNEYFTFQAGIYAISQGYRNCKVDFSDLVSGNHVIRSSEFTCFNTGGFNSEGKPFTKVCGVEKGAVQAFWCGVQIPLDAVPGIYESTVTVTPEGASPQQFKLRLLIVSNVLADKGDNTPAELTRLRWLNSRMAFDDEIVPPYTALTRSGNSLRCLGREIILNELGFPSSINSYFSVEMTHLDETPIHLLSSPISLLVDKKTCSTGTTVFTRETAGTLGWTSTAGNGIFSLKTDATLEFDGCMEYQVTLKALKDGSVNDISLEIPFSADVARNIMGLGLHGGPRPDMFSWKWEQKHNQDAVWIGDVNGGIQASFKDTNYVRPLNTNFYLSKPLNMPPSWYNNSKGGINTMLKGDTYLVTAYSGSRRVKAGEELHFNFRLLITPFRAINTDSQWSTRYYHKYNTIETIKAEGANTINIHHATPINPYINYPFFRPGMMKAYIDSAHRENMKVKIYYTVRELANRSPELFMLRSLGDEVLSHGPGNGFSWLQEHLDTNYIAAWFVPELTDAAIINSGVSRWHNFYVEGLNWLTKNVGIDGLYIDDVAFDRTTMKRVRKILDSNRPGAMIDLHSANQFNYRDGYTSSANLYMEHFPYLNRLWFGEYFDYNAPPSYWLFEMSGIPFGLMGEMLQDDGNPWRGMVFGMTNRRPWSGDPRPIWQAWDKFGMQGSRMIGWWVPGSPVKTGNPSVLATVYKKEGKTMVALASWAQGPCKVKLTVDWAKLGLDAAKASIVAWEIRDFQPAAKFLPGDEITIEPGKGWLLVIE